MYRIPRYSVTLVREKAAMAEVKTIRGPQDAAELMAPMINNLVAEHFQIIMLDTKSHVIGTSLVTIGTLNSTLVSPRDVFQRALLANAASIILIHNHPSGDLTPSQEDISLTKLLISGGKVLCISVQDHLIMGDSGRYLSMKEKEII